MQYGGAVACCVELTWTVYQTDPSMAARQVITVSSFKCSFAVGIQAKILWTPLASKKTVEAVQRQTGHANEWWEGGTESSTYPASTYDLTMRVLDVNTEHFAKRVMRIAGAAPPHVAAGYVTLMHQTTNE